MDKTDEILRLKRQGLTIRDISNETGIPRSTVHKIIRSSPSEDNNDGQVAFNGYADNGRSLLVHLPYNYFCPGCGGEQNHAWLCLECGIFFTAECDEDFCCVDGFDLSDVTRRAELIEG